MGPAPLSITSYDGDTLVGANLATYDSCGTKVPWACIALYIDVHTAAQVLECSTDSATVSLLDRPDCFGKLASARFRKTFRVTYLQQMSERVQRRGARKSWLAILGPGHAAEIDLFVASMPAVGRGDDLFVRYHDDGESVEMIFKSGEHVLQKSAGFWAGMQEEYFCANASRPDWAAMLRMNLPSLLL